MDKITNINQDININNFNIFKKTNKLIINEIIPFINDYLKITISITNDKLKKDEINLFMFNDDIRNFNTFVKTLFNSFKEQYFLNSDIYNFKNDFFEEKIKLKKIEKNKKPKNVVLEKIDIYRKHSFYYIQFNFTLKYLNNSILNEFPIIFNIKFLEIKNNELLIIDNIINNINEKYNFKNYEKSIELYQNLIDIQNKFISEFSTIFNDLKTLNKNTNNIEKFIYE